MPAFFINVGLVVKPEIYFFLFKSTIDFMSAPSAKIFILNFFTILFYTPEEGDDLPNNAK